MNGFSSIGSRPAGPRDMRTSVPSIPAKTPLPFEDLPKPPGRTFSISESARSSQDVHRPPSDRKQSYYGQPIVSAANPQVQKHREDLQPYRPRTPNGVNLAIVPKTNSAEIPHSPTIDAETLSKYLAKYNVLVVDIRDRDQFDEGHIFATSIICIEPLALKEGTSAEMLEERQRRLGHRVP